MFPPLLDIVALALLSIHFSVALAYYRYLKAYKNKSWQLKVDKEYRPYLTTIVPTYNEGQMIERRLDNLASQEYPKDKQQIIVVDSASTDKTTLIVQDWLRANPSMNGTLISEPERNGKFKALQRALTAVEPSSVAVVLTDADAFWDPTALGEVASFLADPEVGSVTGSIRYLDDPGAFSEDPYRTYFNAVRVAESKIHSTPVHNGPLLAIRTEFLRKVGFPTFPGSDDSAFGSLVAFAGYRAIQADTAIVREYMRGNRLRRKIRRAACVLLNFYHTKNYAKKMHVYVRSKFETVWRMEWWLHVVNPWLLLAAIILLASQAISGSLLASAVLLIGLLSLGLKSFRTWMLQQVYLSLGALRSLWTDEAIWNR
jgi:cellulose synthase/poly-beta-1,6-N-acetylglucosamine synthase-like glycosyltransferase